MVGWVFFRADNFAYSFDYLSIMFGGGEALISQETMLYLSDNWIVLLFGILFSMPAFPWVTERIQKIIGKSTVLQVGKDVLSSGIYLALMIIVTMYLVNSTYNPFIYFRF